MATQKFEDYVAALTEVTPADALVHVVTDAGAPRKQTLIAGVVSPASFAADQLNLTVGLLNRVSGTAARNINGAVAAANNASITFYNIGSFNLTFRNENASATAANRFTLPNGDVILYPGSAITFTYSTVTSRWIQTADGGTAGTANPIINGVVAVGTSQKFAREDHVHATDTTLAPKASPSFTGSTLTLADAQNVVVGTTTGTQIGTSTSQKLGFFGSTAIVKPSGDLITALQNLGLISSITIAIPSAATATTQAQGNNTTAVATTAYVDRYTPVAPVGNAPTTGATVTIGPVGIVTNELINPAGTLANLTITFPLGSSYSGQIVWLTFTQAITTLTMTATNITATGALPTPTTAAANQVYGYVFNNGISKWQRFF